jgi:hypothetical protein
VSKDRKIVPNINSADKADVVVWCFPETYPHSSHMFPNSEGRIFIHEHGDTVTFMTEDFVDEVDVELSVLR